MKFPLTLLALAVFCMIYPVNAQDGETIAPYTSDIRKLMSVVGMSF